MSENFGVLVEKQMSVEWPMPDFFSLLPEVDELLASPIFFFAGVAWEFWLYPNGESENDSEGSIGLYLSRRSDGPPKIVTYSLGIRKANGEEEVLLSKKSQIFSPLSEAGWKFGSKKFLERPDLLKRKDQLAPSDTLTVTCTLSVEDGNSSDDSLSTRLWNLSLDLYIVMLTPKDADITFELPDGTLDAHKMILKLRSPVFDSMFSHDMKECRSSEVKIEDADIKSFEIVLTYIYSGDPHGLSSKNVKDVYKLSHKYYLRDLTKCCSEFMRVSLSVDTICDVITIAVLYQDKKLLDSAKDYFIRHKDKIKQTDQWKALKKANAEIVCEMLEYTLDKIC